MTIKIPTGAGRKLESMKATKPGTQQEQEEEAQKLVDNLLNNSTAVFCEAFARFWRGWAINYREQHGGSAKMCKQYRLDEHACDTCHKRFTCYTE